MFFHIFEQFCSFMDDLRRSFCLIGVWMYFKHRVVLLPEVVLMIAKSSAILLRSIIRVSHEYQLFTVGLRGSSELTSGSSSNLKVHALDWYHMTLVMSCSNSRNDVKM